MDTQIILALIAFASLIFNILLGISNGKLQAKIDINKDKLSKIQEKQIETIARLWQKLNLCSNSFQILTNIYQQFPDINKSTETEKNDIFSFYKLVPSQIEKINISTNPNKTLSEIMLTNYYFTFHDEFTSFSIDLENNIFYLPSDIRKLFLELNKFYLNIWRIADPRNHIYYSHEEMNGARIEFYGLSKKFDTEFASKKEKLYTLILNKFNIDDLT